LNSKVCTAAEAVKLIKDGDTVSVAGFVGLANPEEVLGEIEKQFVETGSPRNLFLAYAAGQGDGKDKSLNHFGREGLVRRIVGGHYNLAPKLGKLIIENKVEAYNFPQGVIMHLFRNIAAGKPGLCTHVGLKTFVDPRIEGGKLNEVTKEDLVEVVQLAGKEQLFYKSFPINVAIIRATTADEKGNLSMEKEGVLVETVNIAQAAKNSGGIVIAQVERVVRAGELKPQSVIVPGIYVDHIVVAKPENHWQNNATFYDPGVSGEYRIPMNDLAPMEFDERKVIARRAALELVDGAIVNLGIGMPDGVAAIANEEGIGERITLTVESGPIGGVPTGGGDFGAAVNPDCILPQPLQFDFYDGGGLDVTFLGLAQADEKGNINVSKFGARIAGCGGFINISQNAKKAVFCGTLTAGGLEISLENGKLTIVKEGKSKKFIPSVQQITFSGDYAKENKQPVLYITERAVFELKPEGVTLTEIAPGVDLQKDVLANIEFPVKVATELKLMDARIFKPERMGLKDDLVNARKK
jgi:propionate CoA-transferase